MFANATTALLRPPADDEVHVWSVFLPEARPSLPIWEGFLSKQERETSGRFVRPADQERYTVTHGLLRDLLGRYTNIIPHQLEFVTNAFGKPDLVSTGATPSLRFNLSHSADVILFAITTQRQIGIDVEKIRPDVDVMELAVSQFAEKEIQELHELSVPEKINAFYRCWTRKEAFVKARGDGLSFALNKFAVTLSHTQSVELSCMEGDLNPSNRWSLFNLDPWPGYTAALAVEGRSAKVISQRYNFASK